MTDEWWHSTGRAKSGPVSFQDLRRLVRDGTISPDTLVWKTGQTEWQPLSSVAEYAEIATDIPPPLPTRSRREELIKMPAAGPWRRFFARQIDLWSLALPIGYAAGYVLASLAPGFVPWIQAPGNSYIFGWLLTPVVLLTELIIFSIFQTTLGKFVLGVTVMTVGGSTPTSSEYARRLAGVYWSGLGTGFPLVPLFTMSHQYGLLKRGGEASYDLGLFNVKGAKLGWLRIVAAIVVITLILIVNGVLNAPSR